MKKIAIAMISVIGIAGVATAYADDMQQNAQQSAAIQQPAQAQGNTQIATGDQNQQDDMNAATQAPTDATQAPTTTAPATTPDQGQTGTDQGATDSTDNGSSADYD